MIPEDGMNGSVNVLNEIGAVLSQHHRGIDSEDIKSALIELLKATRSADSNDSGFDSKLKNLLPTVLAMLKHSEVNFIFILFILYPILKSLLLLLLAEYN